MSETKISEEYLKSLQTEMNLTDKEKHIIRNYGKRFKCVFKNCIAVTAPEKVIRIVVTEGEKRNDFSNKRG